VSVECSCADDYPGMGGTVLYFTRRQHAVVHQDHRFALEALP
jgi:hypothetical protein